MSGETVSQPQVISKDKLVVVIDDSPTALRAAASTLQEAGFDVKTASDGEEAITLVTASQPDVIVLDIVLPKKNGFQVCRELRTNGTTENVKIILLSSKNQETDRFWGQRQGADAYLTKPVQAAELVSIVNALATDEGNVDRQLNTLQP